MVTCIALIAFVGVALHPFLSIVNRTNADVLVVEGWVRKYAIQAAVQEFRKGGYQRVYSTGGPVAGLGGYVNDFQTAASVGADRLRDQGIPPELVQMVPSREMGRDRTYSSAVALREWLEDHQISVAGFNVLTEAPHARRTRLLYQKAFGKQVRVGIIAIPSPDYDPKLWFKYSEGVKDLFAETLAYLYVRFFFWPPVPDDESERTRS